MNPNYNLIRLIQQALYALKRDYGGYINVYQGVPTTDIETGEVTRNVSAFPIHRAIVLPVRVLEAVKTLGQGGLSGRLNIIGSHYETGKRLFIIDRRDIPVPMTMNDWIRYDGRKYTFDSVEEYEYHTAYLVTGTELVGEVSIGADLSVSVGNAITLGESAVGSTGP
jgi:hypothetical protein